MTLPELKHGDSSWIIVNKSTNKAVLEISKDNKSLAEKINQNKYRLVPTGEYLATLNKTIQADKMIQSLTTQDVQDLIDKSLALEKPIRGKKPCIIDGIYGTFEAIATIADAKIVNIRSTCGTMSIRVNLPTVLRKYRESDKPTFYNS